MSHKGYVARVEFDEWDNLFVGRILGIRSIISFHGETVDELRTEFVNAVEDYVTYPNARNLGSNRKSRRRAS